jgi:hypothetical protein
MDQAVSAVLAEYDARVQDEEKSMHRPPGSAGRQIDELLVSVGAAR